MNTESKVVYPYKFDPKKRKSAKIYSKQKLYTGVFQGIIIPLITLLLIYYLKISHLLERSIFRSISGTALDHYWLGVAMFVALFISIVFLVGFPISYYSGYVLEHRYDLSNQNFFQWLKDQLKSFVISVLISTPIIAGVFYLGSTYPEWWWLYAGMIAFVLLGVLSNISHLILLPLFFDTEELDDEELAEDLIQIAEKNGVAKVEKVVEVKAGEKTEKANAAFAGMGRTKRIYLFDNLLNKFHKDEVKGVVAHEMGHYVNKDVLRYIALQALLIFPIFYVSGWALEFWGGFTSIANLPIFILILFGLYSLIDPLMLAYSRHREREADRFALGVVKDRTAMVSTFKRLSDIALSEVNPGRVIEIMFYSHPAPKKRIQMAKSIDYKDLDTGK
ncbi:MAG: M48 family metalloprotease [Thermoplasmata archaeon]